MCSAAYFSKYVSTMIDDFPLETHPRATHEGTSPLGEFDRFEKSSEIPILKAKKSALAARLWHMDKKHAFIQV